MFSKFQKRIEKDSSELVYLYYPSKKLPTDTKCSNEDDDVKQSIYAADIAPSDRLSDINLNYAAHVHQNKVYIVGGGSKSLHKVQLTESSGLPPKTSISDSDSCVDRAPKSSLRTKDTKSFKTSSDTEQRPLWRNTSELLGYG